MRQEPKRTGMRVSSRKQAINLTTGDVEKFRNCYDVGDKIRLQICVHISLSDDSTETMVKAGRIVEKYPHVCRIRYWHRGQYHVQCCRWVDLALLERQEGGAAA